MPADDPNAVGPLAVVRCASEDATDALGAAIGALLGSGDLVCLHGDLGAGKTRLVRGIARGIGVDPAIVSSPTFVVMHDYPPVRAGSPGLVHVDAYRLRGADELDTLGWDRVTGGGGGGGEAGDLPALVIEWPERIEGALGRGGLGRGGPQPGGAALRMDVAIGVESQTSREVELVGPAAWMSRPGWADVARLSEGTKPAPGAARACPTCGKPVPADGASVPFCSERCRMADLGKWLSGSFTVSRDLTPDDADEAG